MPGVDDDTDSHAAIGDDEFPGDGETYTTVDEHLSPGTDVGGYVVETELGWGAMGVVYAATHPVIGKRAAIKVLKPELSRNPAAVERFMMEARAVNQIGHPNIVDIFAFGALPDGRSYYVMDLLQGESLRKRLKRGPMHVSEAVSIIDEVSSALIAAHDKGIVHRDLKPDNIFMVTIPGRWPEVKLLDWGLLKLTSAQSAVSSARYRTLAGSMMGTPVYMSPEQARASDQVDYRTDIYALGVMAYELLSGEVPFRRGSSMETILAHQDEPVPSLAEKCPALPIEVVQLIEAMLSKEPDGRPTLGAVRTVLKRLKGTKIPTMTAAGLEVTPLPSSRAATRPVASYLDPPTPELTDPPTIRKPPSNPPANAKDPFAEPPTTKQKPFVEPPTARQPGAKTKHMPFVEPPAERKQPAKFTPVIESPTMMAPASFDPKAAFIEREEPTGIQPLDFDPKKAFAAAESKPAFDPNQTMADPKAADRARSAAHGPFIEAKTGPQQPSKFTPVIESPTMMAPASFDPKRVFHDPGEATGIQPLSFDPRQADSNAQSLEKSRSAATSPNMPAAPGAITTSRVPTPVPGAMQMPLPAPPTTNQGMDAQRPDFGHVEKPVTTLAGHSMPMPIGSRPPQYATPVPGTNPTYGAGSNPYATPGTNPQYSGSGSYATPGTNPSYTGPASSYGTPGTNPNYTGPGSNPYATPGTNPSYAGPGSSNPYATPVPGSFPPHYSSQQSASPYGSIPPQASMQTAPKPRKQWLLVVIVIAVAAAIGSVIALSM